MTTLMLADEETYTFADPNIDLPQALATFLFRPNLHANSVSLSSLPLEILEHILGFLAEPASPAPRSYTPVDRAQKRDLARAARVSRTLHRLSTPILYRDLVVELAAPYPSYQPAFRPAYHLLFDKHPRLQHYPRTLKLNGNNVTSAVVPEQLVEALLSRMPNLIELTCINIYHSRVLSSVSAGLSHSIFLYGTPTGSSATLSRRRSAVGRRIEPASPKRFAR
ncbi:hypothetical protein BCR35DRAFT_88586 [Leucosporidium creatinivorum]|uniref:F-box domain-containing protein n=1 Tax=Leucosporidium creatinivorum TaxID=106004 RepID=A0A1Y2FB36_9BASI|nr:hypothetical protein BCR35DRAFT_88586 [Leucosporidium creatinivorum]